MLSLLVVVGVAAFALVALMVGLQYLIRRRVRALIGKPAPRVPGTLGRHIVRGQEVLVYFHSPGCAACRAWTPHMIDLSRRHSRVCVVDVSRELELARSFGVMATPSCVHVMDGRIADYRVGAIPSELLVRFEATQSGTRARRATAAAD